MFSGLVPLTKCRYITQKNILQFKRFSFFTKISARGLKTLRKKYNEHSILRKISLKLRIRIKPKLKDLNVEHNMKELQEILDMANSKS
jgi:hypothetical protein